MEATACRNGSEAAHSGHSRRVKGFALSFTIHCVIDEDSAGRGSETDIYGIFSRR